ncbi:MAG: sporulation protein YunB [Erysipelotrichaceae bacterium]|nr:sporulation protein YunB [Erysipelotrichaceae bacterium]
MKRKTTRKRPQHRWKRNRFLMIALLFLSVFLWWVRSLNDYMEPRLQAIAKQNVIFAINNITQSVLRDLEYDPGTLIHIDKQEDGTISSIQYDSYQLNQILFTALNTIDQSLADSEGEQLQDGEEIYFKNGAVFECPIGYLTKIPFLSNSGPRIPIRLKLLNDITGEIKVDSTPYGVNSTLIRAYMKISVKTQVITILSTSEMETTTEIPIIVQVVSGQVPGIVPYVSESMGS